MKTTQKRQTMVQSKLSMYVDTLTNSIDKVYSLKKRLQNNESDRKKLRDEVPTGANLDIDKMNFLLCQWDDLDFQIELEEAKQKKIKSLILDIEKFV